MSRNWEEFVISRDQSGRIYIARCALCDQLIAACPDKLKTVQLAANHDCKMDSSSGSAGATRVQRPSGLLRRD